MLDPDLIALKAAAVRRHLSRARHKAGDSLARFKKDLDRQDIVVLNLQQAIQNCIDIAAHIVAENDLGVPGSTSEMFYLLEESGCLPMEITETMIRAVGFRNLIAHEYSRLDLDRVYEVARRDGNDLNSYLAAIFRHLGLVGSEADSLC